MWTKFNVVFKSFFIIIAMSIVSVVVVGSSTNTNYANEDLNKVVNPVSVDAFMKYMMNEDWDVVVDPAKKDLVDGYANANLNGMEIEFYKYESVNDARIKFIDNNEDLLSNISGSYAIRSFTWKNGERITVGNDGRYILLSRVDDTMIFLNVKSDYKSDVVEIIKDIGY